MSSRRCRSKAQRNWRSCANNSEEKSSASCREHTGPTWTQPLKMPTLSKPPRTNAFELTLSTKSHRTQGSPHWRKKDALFRTPKSRLKYSRGSSNRRTAKGGHSPKKSSMRSAVGPPSTSLQLTRSPLCTRCEKTVLQPQPGQSSWPKHHQPSCLERTSRGGSSHSDAHIPVIGRHWLVTSGLERCTCDNDKDTTSSSSSNTAEPSTSSTHSCSEPSETGMTCPGSHGGQGHWHLHTAVIQNNIYCVFWVFFRTADPL